MLMYWTSSRLYFFFFFNDTATTEIYTLSLHDALPISASVGARRRGGGPRGAARHAAGRSRGRPAVRRRRGGRSGRQPARPHRAQVVAGQDRSHVLRGAARGVDRDLERRGARRGRGAAACVGLAAPRPAATARLAVPNLPGRDGHAGLGPPTARGAAASVPALP